MPNIYIDESGSMTTNHPSMRYFVISMVVVHDPTRLKKAYKRFVSKNLKRLKQCDTNNVMFSGDKFKELKGNSFTPKLKREFVQFFCQGNYFDVFYIVVANSNVEDRLYSNTARAFNYLVKLALRYYLNNGYISNDSIVMQLDERNEKTETKYFLENYLNTEFQIEGIVSNDIKVSYFDSSYNAFIQIADVFSNIMYSQLKIKGYTNELTFMRENGYLKHVFRYPLK